MYVASFNVDTLRTSHQKDIPHLGTQSGKEWA